MNYRKYMAIILWLFLVFLSACQMQFDQTTLPSPTGPEPGITETPLPEVNDFVTGLESPWAIAFAPDSRIFITERSGNIRVVINGQLSTQPWITLDVTAIGEAGLLGLAIDPDFTDNHYVYAAYTYRDDSGDLKNQIVRLRDDTETNQGIMDMVLLNDIPAGSNHNGGRVKFGPDGKLYWTMGDAGNADTAQDLSSLNGKILRLNADGTIPEDNPFPGSTVYSYGHRNPQGLAWQPGTGRLYSTEHGSSATDEVNLIEAGQNYGWPIIRGDESQANLISPVIHSGVVTWAPSGAAFADNGPWEGSLLFVGLRGQSLYRLLLDQDNPSKVVKFESYFTGEYGRLRDIVQGPDGALYILTNNTDGRGRPQSGDDKILQLIFT
jgi:glucose/arabinose dehydrogenase